MNHRATVIVPVYNSPRLLELVLAGYGRQSIRDYELFIADDGSGPEIRMSVDKFACRAPFPVSYTRQPDKGFRKTRIMNQAVREASADYLIFADADCIPHRDFVAAHAGRRAARTVLCGRRVNLSRRLSQRLTAGEIAAGRLERFPAGGFIEALCNRRSHWDEGIVLRNPALHAWLNRRAPTILGSNFSLEKSLFAEVNGFNEDFVGYGGEDTELEYRLRLAGAAFRWVRQLAIQYHLHHPPRPAVENRMDVLRQTEVLGAAACRNGLRKAGP